MIIDYIWAAVLMGTGFGVGWVWRGYTDHKRRQERLRLRRVMGARTAVARDGSTPARVRQGRINR